MANTTTTTKKVLKENWPFVLAARTELNTNIRRSMELFVRLTAHSQLEPLLKKISLENGVIRLNGKVVYFLLLVPI